MSDSKTAIWIPLKVSSSIKYVLKISTLQARLTISYPQHINSVMVPRYWEHFTLSIGLFLKNIFFGNRFFSWKNEFGNATQSLCGACMCPDAGQILGSNFSFKQFWLYKLQIKKIVRFLFHPVSKWHTYYLRITGIRQWASCLLISELIALDGFVGRWFIYIFYLWPVFSRCWWYQEQVVH